jgi:cytochrome c biogenesis protein CcdA/thiol-disulfide isomerase/thioredoxin
MSTLIIVAFLAGMLTIASPCVLMVLPILLSTSIGGGKLRPVGIVIGFAIAFTAFTLAFAGALQALALPVSWLRIGVIIALGIFGLSLLVPPLGHAWERLLAPLARVANPGTARSGFGGGLLIGSGLGLLWAPCAGPLMAFVIGLTAYAGLSPEGVAITLAYTLGAGVPMLLIAYGTRSFTARAKRLGRRTGAIQQVFGALTVMVAIGLLLGLDTQIQSFAQRSLPPEWNSALTSLERQDSVQTELSVLEERNSMQAEVKATIPEGDAKSAAVPKVEIPATSVPATPTTKPMLALEDMGPAPELVGLTGWINSEPLTMEQLRGKVVIIDFWTFGCYNCRNTRPYVRALYDKYKDQGLEIIGVHAPEFAYEKVPANVRAAAKEQGVTWPVALDENFKTWGAYKNRYWPAFYFIDAQGHIRHEHFGEGNYEYNEKVVQQLLSEAKTTSLK